MNTPHDRATGRDRNSRTDASPGIPAHAASNPSGIDTDASAAEQVKAEGKAQLDQYRDEAADTIDTLADSVEAAASKLESDDAGSLSGHIADMADGMRRLSDGLRNKSADQILDDVQRIARDNPALFIAGSIALGFGLTRFARASAQGKSTRNEPDAGRASTARPTARQRDHVSDGGTDSTPATKTTPNISGVVSQPAAAGGGIDDAALGTAAGSTTGMGRSHDSDGTRMGGGATAASAPPDALDAPYDTTPEQSNGRKPS